MVGLIDEYDKPILDNILNGDRARELCEGLKNLYSVLKDELLSNSVYGRSGGSPV
nr:AAA family ATPase [Halomonas meridiana]